VRLFKVLRLEEPDAVPTPALSIALAQPVVEVVAEHGTGHAEPEDPGKIDLCSRGQRTQQ